MEKEILEKYQKAGEIHKQAKDFAKPQIKEGKKILDLAESIEKFIKDKGGELAFPVNISINDIAAHFTPDANDETVLKQNDMVKVDIGVHIDGYIADSAFSVAIGEKSNVLIKAAEDAVSQFIKTIRPGKTIEEMSGLVEDVVTSHGVSPIRNLAGHSLENFKEHGGISIPNARCSLNQKIEEGTAIGMEVFTTNGEGWVRESSPTSIYMFLRPNPVRLRESRLILQKIVEQYKTLPFAKRWLKDMASPLKLHMALKEMTTRGVLHEYPPLREKSNAVIAQAEETIIVLDKPIVTTI